MIETVFVDGVEVNSSHVLASQHKSLFIFKMHGKGMYISPDTMKVGIKENSSYQ